MEDVVEHRRVLVRIMEVWTTILPRRSAGSSHMLRISYYFVRFFSEIPVRLDNRILALMYIVY
ncbi:MAG: hypothetical protein QXT07_03310 [Archaeoglobaceae archaeon]